MVGEPPDFEQFVNHLLGSANQFQGMGQAERDNRIDPPEHWLSQDVQLHNNQRTVQGTIPAFMCRQVGISRENPPEVSVFFDPYTEVVIYDIANRFRDG